MPDDIETLNHQYGIESLLAFERGEGGLTRAVITGPHGQGSVYLHGAHAATWRPEGHEEVLWLSSASEFADGKPIRGGVPVCFPWFGAKADDPDAPSHGLARTRAWDVAGSIPTEDGACLFLSTVIEPWDCVMTIGIGRQHVCSLRVRNIGGEPATFEAALHTYLSVGDIKQAAVEGLGGVDYLDQLQDRARHTQGDQPIRFTSETDRIYVDTEGPVTLRDPALGRRIDLTRQGSRSAVVWNPWIDKAARMPDFGDDEWPGMMCLETANAGPNAVELAPGQSHEMTATLAVARL